MENYKRFLAIWECIRQMNNAGIYYYGYATHADGGRQNPPKKIKKDGRKND